MSRVREAYKADIISTIVDAKQAEANKTKAYKADIISTIVD